jgi:hypothetical protein
MGNDPLAELKPLIEPQPISYWPSAPGWWVLGALLVIAIVFLAIKGWKRWCHYRGTRYQREAQQLLTMVINLEQGKQLQEIAVILRRAAICAWGRERVGTLLWRDIVAMQSANTKNNKQTPLNDSSIKLLDEHLYRQQMPSTQSIEDLLAQSAAWLKTLPQVEN